MCAQAGRGPSTSQNAMRKRSVEELLRPAAAGQLDNGRGGAVAAGRVGGLGRRCCPSSPVRYPRVDRFVLLVSLALLLAIILFISSSEVPRAALASQRHAPKAGLLVRKTKSGGALRVVPNVLSQRHRTTPEAISQLFGKEMRSVVISIDDKSLKSEFFANANRAFFECHGGVERITDDCLGKVTAASLRRSLRYYSKITTIYLVADSHRVLWKAHRELEDALLPHKCYLNAPKGAPILNNKLDDANLLPGVGNLEDYLEWFATEETVQGVFVSYLKVSDPKSPTSQLLLGPEFDLQALEKSIISFSYVKDERVKSVGSRCNRDSCSLSLRIEDGSFTLFDMSSGWTKDDLEDYNTDEEPALRGVRGILVGVYEETATFFPSHKTAPFADLRQKIGRDGIPLTEDRKYKLEAVFFAVQQRKK